MKTLSAFLVAAAVALPIPTQAQKIDLTTMKCKQFTQASKENVSMIMTWLVGYYTEEGQPEIIDVEKVKEVGDKLSSFCSQNPNFGLTGAAEGLLSK